MTDFERKKELWRQALFAFREFKGLCRDINNPKHGRRKRMPTERIGLTERLRCGCEPHGHKCLVAEGGCGRCTGHCICPSQTDVLVIRKLALERLEKEETRCDRLDGRVVEVVIREWVKHLNESQEAASYAAKLETALKRIRAEHYNCKDKDCGASVIAGKALALEAKGGNNEQI